MLSFDIRSLIAHAAQVDGALGHTDAVWEPGDPLPVEGVAASGRLSAAGAERFYWRGRIDGDALVQCRRCLTSVTVPVSEEVHLLFTTAADDEVDDADVYRLSPRASVLDLRGAVREQWLLAVPAFAECRAECKGLCSRCGADRNVAPCECLPEVDGRSAALRGLRGGAR
jgi:uncharacterized protein